MNSYTVQVRVKAAKAFSDIMSSGEDVAKNWIYNPSKFFNWFDDNYFDGARVDRVDSSLPYSEANCKMSRMSV